MMGPDGTPLLCEYLRHRGAAAAAEWAIVYKPGPASCGCTPPQNRLLCDACVRRRMAASGVTCASCGQRGRDTWGAIARVERLSA